MCKLLLPLALIAAPMSLSACATIGSISGAVVLNTDKGFLIAQTAFEATQRAAITMIRNGQLTGATKAKVIDLLDKGADLEARAHDLHDSASITALIGVVSDLSKLGIKGN